MQKLLAVLIVVVVALVLTVVQFVSHNRCGHSRTGVNALQMQNLYPSCFCSVARNI